MASSEGKEPMSRPLDWTPTSSVVAHGEGRQRWVEVAKGLGILVVVWYHVVGSLRHVGAPAWLLQLNTNWDERLRNAMPIFFFVSGLLAVRTLRKPGRDFRSYLVERLLYPYVLWSVVSVLLSVYIARDEVNRTLELSDVALIAWRPLLQYWYLLALVVYLIGARLVLLVDASGRAMAALVALAWAALALGIGVEGHFSRMLELQLGFFCVGLLAGPALVAALERRGDVTLGIVALIGLAGIGVLVQPDLDWPTWDVLPAFVGYLSLGAFLVLAVLVARRWPGSWLEYVGSRSLAIYVAHVIAIAGARVLLVDLGVRSIPVHLVAGMLAGVLGPLALDMAVRRAELPSPFRLAPSRR